MVYFSAYSKARFRPYQCGRFATRSLHFHIFQVLHTLSCLYHSRIFAIFQNVCTVFWKGRNITFKECESLQKNERKQNTATIRQLLLLLYQNCSADPQAAFQGTNHFESFWIILIIMNDIIDAKMTVFSETLHTLQDLLKVRRELVEKLEEICF